MKEKDTAAALKELYKMIGYSEEGLVAKKPEKTEMPKDYVHTVISVHLNSFSFK